MGVRGTFMLEWRAGCDWWELSSPGFIPAGTCVGLVIRRWSSGTVYPLKFTRLALDHPEVHPLAEHHLMGPVCAG